MASDGLAPIRDLAKFRRRKNGDGVIAIRGTITLIHHPVCSFVAEGSFLEKLSHSSGGYFWAPSVEAVQQHWTGASVCRHPSEPLAVEPVAPRWTAGHPPPAPPS